MNKTLRTAFLATTATLMAGCSALAPRAEQEAQKEPVRSEAQIKKQKELAAELGVFANAVIWVSENSADPISYKELMTRALKGMVGSLDPHSTYLDEEEMDQTETSTSGGYGGVGISLQTKDGVTRVLEVFENMPAAAAGIKAGDIITSVDGVAASGMKESDIVSALRGEAGEDVSIGIQSEGAAPREVVLKRVEVVKPTVFPAELKDGIAYIRISGFSMKTTGQLQKAIRDIEAKGNAEAYVLDLRGNLGGSLLGAIGVSDVFLEKGQIVSGRGQKDPLNAVAKPGDAIGGKPLAVLVNGRSASASEIVAGALKDNGRAKIFGVQTYGKGLVQSWIRMSEFDETRKDGFQITTQYYFTPSGVSIQKNGITPHVEIDDAVEAETLKRREENLDGALDNPDSKKTASTTAPPAETCKLAATATKETVDQKFLRASGKAVDTALLCSFEYLKGQVSHTQRVPYVPKPAETPAKPAA